MLLYQSAHRSRSSIPKRELPSVAEEADKLGIPAIVAAAYAFRFPKRDLARYALLLKPVRPVELLQALKNALRL